MRTIHKYAIQSREAQLMLPKGAKIVLIGIQGGNDLYVWADVDSTAPLEARVFEVRGTGHPVKAAAIHVASFQDPPYVWHLFEIPGEKP